LHGIKDSNFSYVSEVLNSTPSNHGEAGKKNEKKSILSYGKHIFHSIWAHQFYI
jgi:hypothetical protein